jgi:hypothetical protein
LFPVIRYNLRCASVSAFVGIPNLQKKLPAFVGTHSFLPLLASQIYKKNFEVLGHFREAIAVVGMLHSLGSAAVPTTLAETINYTITPQPS